MAKVSVGSYSFAPNTSGKRGLIGSRVYRACAIRNGYSSPKSVWRSSTLGNIIMIKTIVFVLVLWNGPNLHDGHFTDSVKYLSVHGNKEQCVKASEQKALTLAQGFSKDDQVRFIMSCVEATDVITKGTRPNFSDLFKSK
jgi:hypothetical protein